MLFREQQTYAAQLCHVTGVHMCATSCHPQWKWGLRVRALRASLCLPSCSNEHKQHVLDVEPSFLSERIYLAQSLLSGLATIRHCMFSLAASVYCCFESSDSCLNLSKIPVCTSYACTYDTPYQCSFVELGFVLSSCRLHRCTPCMRA